VRYLKRGTLETALGAFQDRTARPNIIAHSFNVYLGLQTEKITNPLDQFVSRTPVTCQYAASSLLVSLTALAFDLRLDTFVPFGNHDLPIWTLSAFAFSLVDVNLASPHFHSRLDCLSIKDNLNTLFPSSLTTTHIHHQVYTRYPLSPWYPIKSLCANTTSAWTHSTSTSSSW
jgi:hypothetical protein